jgi:NAD(P)-dependent dehydrogenase (short-subunit alcohol dehydrogenase family)
LPNSWIAERKRRRSRWRRDDAAAPVFVRSETPPGCFASDAETVAADIRTDDGEATAAKIDVTKEAEWIDLVAEAVATYGRLDICRIIPGFRAARLATILG